MAQWFKALAAHTSTQDQFPVTTLGCLQQPGKTAPGGSDTFFWPLWMDTYMHTHGAYAYTNMCL